MADTSSGPRSTHVLADLWGVDPEVLRDSHRIEALMREAAVAARANKRCLHNDIGIMSKTTP